MNVNLISIIVPVYNQADHLEHVVSSYENALERVHVPHELLLVPNGCKEGDRTPEVCEELASRYASVRVVHSKKGGWGAAVRAGLAEAKGDHICYTNLARTTAQDLALMVLYGVVNPQVVVKANRRIRESWRRRLGSLLYNLECRWLFDLSNWDINGTPKVFPRAFGRLLELQSDDDLIDAEFSAICRDEDYAMLEVPIFSTRRHGGKSTTNYGSAFKMYWGAIKLKREMQQKGAAWNRETSQSS
jgi:glycosyltransferase involved in cell wall biosynthesis